MKKRYLFFLLPLIILSIFMFSCDGNIFPPGDSDDDALPAGISDLLLISIDDTDYSNTAGYDFGVVEAEGSGKTVSVTLINNSDSSITVNSLNISDTDSYSVTAPSMPFIAEPGSETDASLTFSPGASEDFDAVLTIVIEGTTETFTLNLSGTGNYAPEIRFGTDVSDAGISDANGFYERDGFLDTDYGNRRPNYKKSGSPDYYVYAVSIDGDIWAIDQTQSNTNPVYVTWNNIDSMSPQETGWGSWGDNSNDISTPTVTVYDIKGTYMQVDSTITASYLYFDQDGDAENSSAVGYQWYRSTSEDGTYTAVSGATSKNYTLTAEDAGYYFKVGITTAASDGFTEGITGMSSPTIQTEAGAQQR